MSRKRPHGSNDAPDSSASKRRRQYTEQDSKNAKLYEDLASEAKDVRMKAAKELIVQFSPANNPSAEAVRKALGRLIRGLCSSRKAARFGFFVTLTELLRQIFGPDSTVIEGLELDINGLIELVVARTQPEGKVAGQEKRDYLLGRLFGYKAILQSSILLQTPAPKHCWTAVLDYVCGLARDKVLLREECGMMLCDAVKSLESISESDTYLKELLERLSSLNIAKTPEGVAVWLTAQSIFPQEALPDGVWEKKDPLNKKERKALARIMREDFYVAPENQDSNQKIKSASHPNPSFAWDVVLATVIRQEDQKRQAKKSEVEKSAFAKLWIDIVDENLFLADASLERKSWGFQLFSKTISTVPDWAVPMLFSPNLVRSLINQQKDADRFLHGSAKLSLNAIHARVKAEPSIASDVLAALTSKNGSINFDQLTKTKTLEGILSMADDDALEKIVARLRSLILRPETQEQSPADFHRQLISNMLLSAVRGYKGLQQGLGSAKGSSWLLAILETFVDNAYFVPNKRAKTGEVPLPAISDSSREMFKSRLSSCLTHLVAFEREGEQSFSFLVTSLIRSKSESSDSLQVVFSADEQVLQTVDQAHRTLNSLAPKANKRRKSATTRAFVVLYSLTILQVYNGDADAVLLLGELRVCYDSISQKKTSVAEQSFDMLLEILLSFLGKPSLLFRKLAGQVFETFTADLTPSGVESLCDILEKDENLAGQQELFDQGGDEADEVESSDDSEEASDVEMIDGEGASGEDDSDDTSATDEDAETDDRSEDDGSVVDAEEDGNEEELAKFDALLAETLKTSNQAADMEGVSSDDEDMDDEQMMALEPHLTKIFQERSKITSKKKDNKDAKTTVINFKTRVLDLLLIYVKKEHANPLALQLILPLLRRVRSNTSRQIAEKSFRLLKDYFAASNKAKSGPELENEDRLWEILREIHTEANADGSTMHSTACSRASLFIAKLLVSIDKSNLTKVHDEYSKTQRAWYEDSKSRIHVSFFGQWLDWSNNARKQKM